MIISITTEQPVPKRQRGGDTQINIRIDDILEALKSISDLSRKLGIEGTLSMFDFYGLYAATLWLLSSTECICRDKYKTSPDEEGFLKAALKELEEQLGICEPPF